MMVLLFCKLPSFPLPSFWHHKLNVSDTNGYFENVRATSLFSLMDNMRQYGKPTDKTRCGCYDNCGGCYGLLITQSEVTYCIGALLIGGLTPLLLLAPTTAHHSIKLVGACAAQKMNFIYICVTMNGTVVCILHMYSVLHFILKYAYIVQC